MTTLDLNYTDQRWGRWGWLFGALLLGSALTAKQFVGEPDWIATLAQAGALLVAVGVAFDLAATKTGKSAYRTALGLAIGAVLLLGWVNAAVGLIGSEDNPANLMYGAVFLVCAIGAAIARLEPVGMSRALFATAATQALVAAVVLVGGISVPLRESFEVFAINGFFIALFIGSAVLFAKAAKPSGQADHPI